MKQFFKDFGAFISKGNALDLAVGLVLGTAFNAIIKSLVNDIIMPLLGLIVQSDFKSLYVVLRGTATYDTTLGQLILSEDAVLLTYGNFIQAIIDFLIIALAIFLALKVIMRFRTKVDEMRAKNAEADNQSQPEAK
ncbi:MAG: large conductance mechanosensitive channel protein MscL [Bacilli bacterium]|nr:large conductance mechanosensitive channel protein MscL [Bacilli bacterium]MBN2696252.1 large conductance mechanosensitive channel protein MscL [Bacilli bacterium]